MFKNRKKIRGWNRQLKKLRSWQCRNMQLVLNKSEVAYVKISLDPWYRLVKRNPPLWFRRLILKALIEIYDSWYLQLLELKNSDKFYLKIWLYDPHFMSSQVVAAWDQNAYQYAFSSDPEDSPYPRKYQAYNLEELLWESAIEEDFYYEKIDELTPNQINLLKQRAARVGQLANGEVFYAISSGHVWLGMKPTASV
jgi:hypothetical protein